MKVTSPTVRAGASTEHAVTTSAKLVRSRCRRGASGGEGSYRVERTVHFDESNRLLSTALAAYLTHGAPSIRASLFNSPAVASRGPVPWHGTRPTVLLQ